MLQSSKLEGRPALLLASKSPRRRELLAQIGVKHRVVQVEVDESMREHEAPDAFVERLAINKMRAGLRSGAEIADDLANLPVLGADTVVTIDNVILGKPNTPAIAVEMLQRLSGRTHQVISGVAVGTAEKVLSSVCSTAVTFKQISVQESEDYVATQEPMDKAGAYGIQGFGGVFVENIVGSYSNVVGLPLFETAALLKQFSVNVWQNELMRNVPA